MEFTAKRCGGSLLPRSALKELPQMYTPGSLSMAVTHDGYLLRQGSEEVCFRILVASEQQQEIGTVFISCLWVSQRHLAGHFGKQDVGLDVPLA